MTTATILGWIWMAYLASSVGMMSYAFAGMARRKLHC